MSKPEPSAFANVFSAFQKGFEGSSAVRSSETAPEPAAAPQQPEPDTFALVAMLQVLADGPEGGIPFSQFAAQVPAGPVSTLSSVVKLMKEGWVEFVGEISENSAVRLTPRGRELVSTLRGSVAAA